eukprot:8077003-Pyramimonas_sp.AAC.1
MICHRRSGWAEQILTDPCPRWHDLGAGGRLATPCGNERCFLLGIRGTHPHLGGRPGGPETPLPRGDGDSVASSSF